MKTIICLVFSVLLNFILIANSQAQKSHYKIANTFRVAGDERWDLLSVDETTGRLYLSHGIIVQVVDVKTGKLLGTIQDTKGVHGIALAVELNKGFTSNGRDTSVTVFDLKSLQVITKIKVTGKNPDYIMYDKSTQRVFVFNGRSGNATVIDAKTNIVIETIALSGKPELAVSDEKGKIYLNLEDKNKVVVINSVTMKVEQEWPLAPGEEPSGIALDTQNHVLFSGCNNKLMVMMDANTGKVITTLPIGEKVDGVVFDPALKCAYSSNGEGTITVIKEEGNNKFKVLETINTQQSAKTITLNTKTHHLYLPAAEFTIPANDNQKTKVKPGTFVILDVCPVH